MALSGVDDRAHPTAARTEAALNRPLRILLVEDSAEDAELLQRALRREGRAAVYQRVDDPADLKAALDAGAWDVILSDYRLPGFTGLEVVAQVQARGYDGPLILVSGTIGEESVVEALKAGVHDYVLKDDLTRLSPAIRRELREAENRRERQAAAEALRASELRLRLITDGMLDLIGEVDLAGRLRYVSPSHRTTLGYEPAEMVGHGVFEYVHPDDLQEILTTFQTAVERRAPAAVVCRFRHAAGHYLWVESRGNPVFDEAGRLLGAVLSSRDITARRQAESAEREQRQLAEALSNTAAALSSSLDLPVVLERVLDNVGRVVPHDAAVIMLTDGRTIQLAAQRGLTRFADIAGLAGRSVPLAEAASAATILRTGQAVIFAGHPECANPNLAAALCWARMCLGAPLRHRGEVLGLISLHSAAPDAFTEVQAARLQALADQAAVAIAHARLFERERQRVAELQRLNAFTTALAQVAIRLQSTHDVGQVMQTVGAELRALQLTCFIALREPGETVLTIRYVSIQPPLLAAVERLAGLKVVGFQLTAQNFLGFDRFTQQSQPEFLRDLPRLLSGAFRFGLPLPVIQRALTLAGIGPADNLAILPLAAADELVGLLEVWGPGLAEADLTALSIFAGQVALALAKARLFEAERRRAAELERANALMTALARVSARIESTVDPEQAMQSLGEALRQLNLWCFIALPEADGARLRVHYTNLESAAARLAMRTLGVQPGQTRLSAEMFPDVYTAVQTRRPILRADVLANLPAAWRQVPRPAVEFALSQMQLKAGLPFAVIPLLVEEQVRGVLSVWGGDLREVDAAPLSVFAGQLAAALEKGRLLETERRRTAELDRSNRLISALASVSARVQANPAMEVVLETLGTHLRPLGVSCLVALQEAAGADLRLRYLMVDSDLLTRARKLTGVTMDQYRLPRRAAIVSECLDERRPVFTRDLAPLIGIMLPGLSHAPIAQLVSLLGVRPGQAALLLPLQVEAEPLGLFALWGAALEAADVPAYTVFASQLAAALHTAQLVAHLDQARRAAEEANQLKSLFLANVSHELRTPLTGILGSLDLVLGGVCETPAEEHQFLGLARDAGQRLHRLINDLLDLARIEAGHLQVEIEAQDVIPVVAQACVLCRPAAEAKQIQLRFDLAPGARAYAGVDPDRLTQIMLNLLGNAVKFTEAGEVRVTVQTQPATGEVEIRVEDTGIGIPAAVQAQLFRPFVQLDSSPTRKYGGTGLGLAISRRLAELMHGRLTLHSAGAGTGSTFSVFLPWVDPAAPLEAPSRQPAEKEARP